MDQETVYWCHQFIAPTGLHCLWSHMWQSQVNMTHQSHDQISPSDTGYFSGSGARGGSSSETGSGGSSCEGRDHDRDQVMISDQCHMSDSDNDDGMDTIKRNYKHKEPMRPPRTIDGQSQSQEYYNLCHPAPTTGDPAPALPRRAPFISHGAATSERPDWSGECRGDQGARCQSRASEVTTTLSSLASRHTSINNKRKYLSNNRRRKGSVCNCKHVTGNNFVYHIIIMQNMMRACWYLSSGWLQSEWMSLNDVSWADYINNLFLKLILDS